MQIYFHSRLCSYLPRVPILVEGTVCSYIALSFSMFSTWGFFTQISFEQKYDNDVVIDFWECCIKSKSQDVPTTYSTPSDFKIRSGLGFVHLNI